MFVLTLLACENLDGPDFGGGGERYASGEVAYGGGSGTTGEDTGDTGGSADDTGYKLEEGAPSLGGATLVMSDAGDGTASVVGTVAYEDDEGDVVGGRLYLDWYGSADGSSPGDATLSIGSTADTGAAQYAYAGETAINFYVSLLNPTLEYQFVLQVVDASGYTSNAASGTVGPL